MKQDFLHLAIAGLLSAAPIMLLAAVMTFLAGLYMRRLNEQTSDNPIAAAVNMGCSTVFIAPVFLLLLLAAAVATVVMFNSVPGG